MGKREKMCVRFTLIIANSLLALLGLLLLAGGVWRVVDDGSLREVANEIKDTQEWDEVKKGVDGLEEAVQEAASHKYFNYALLAMGGVTLLVALFGFCGAKKESQCLLSLYSICVFIILPSRSPPSCSLMLTTLTSTSSRKRSATKLRRSTSRTLRSWLPGRSLCRTCSSGSLPASPPSSSSSRSPSAVERGGRRECKDMLRLFRLNQAHSAILFVSNIFLSTKTILQKCFIEKVTDPDIVTFLFIQITLFIITFL